MTHVSIKNLSKIYAGSAHPSLDSVSLEIESGKITVLVGPSGCGKTTLLKLIAGLLDPSGGDVAFDGRSIMRDKPEHRNVVMVFQNNLLFPFMSVNDNVAFGLKMRKVPKIEIAARVAEMLDLVQLPDLGHRNPAGLSGGQQQRVALARALIVRPKVLLLDEPLSNLDAHLRLDMRDLIRDLQKKLGITTIFVTHDQEEAVVLADRMALIIDGKLRQFDRPDMFFNCPADRTVAEFFGGQNFVQGKVVGTVFTSPFGQLTLSTGMAQGHCTMTIRPEAIRIGAGAANTLTAEVTDRIYLGTQTRLKFSVGGIVLDSLQSPDSVQGIVMGQRIQINLPPQSLWFLP